MNRVIGVRFTPNGKIYDFDASDLAISENDRVIVETMRGLDLGQCVVAPRELDDSRLVAPLRPVVRIATDEDVERVLQQQQRRDEVLTQASDRILTHNLDMKLVDVEFTFEGKIVFFFTAEGRIDFRDLVRDLAAIFRTRIELRQIGVRDEAKMLGGIGPCGRSICCRQFLPDFQPVSIKMAKEQGLSLNPTKISGLCGRLLCCLKYEQDSYEAVRRAAPKQGKEIVTPDGVGMVTDINVLKETARVRFFTADNAIDVREYPFDLLRPIGSEPAVVPEKPAEEQPASPARARRDNGRPQTSGNDRISRSDADRAAQLRSAVDDAPTKPAQVEDARWQQPKPQKTSRFESADAPAGDKAERPASRWRGSSDEREHAAPPAAHNGDRRAPAAKPTEQRAKPAAKPAAAKPTPKPSAKPDDKPQPARTQEPRPAGRANRDERPVRPITGNRDDRRNLPSLRDTQPKPPAKPTGPSADKPQAKDAGQRTDQRPKRPPRPPQQRPTEPPARPNQPLVDPSVADDLSPDTFGARSGDAPRQPRKPRRHNRGPRQPSQNQEPNQE